MSEILKRNKDIVAMKNAGKTQREIAQEYNISRQRIQQIESSLGLNRKKESLEKDYMCKNCGDMFTSRNIDRKYCSRECSSSFRKVKRTAKELHDYQEKLKEKKRIYAREYYKTIAKKKRLDK